MLQYRLDGLEKIIEEIDYSDKKYDRELISDLGRYSFVVKPEKFKELFPDLYRMYPKDNITLKVFYNEDMYGDFNLNLEDQTKIQNIFYWKGLSAYVYNVVKINNVYAQVIEYIKGEFGYYSFMNIHRLIHEICEEEWMICPCDARPENLVNNRKVDFGGFKFKDKDKYKQYIIETYKRDCIFGHPESTYQSIEALGINSAIRNDNRKNLFELDKYDFENKTVLDMGCSGGYFVNYCSERGARAIGIDIPDVIRGARESANFVGYFGSEFYVYDLLKDGFVEFIREKTGIQRFDYVFFTSMDQHIGFKDYLGELADTLFFESNGGKHEDEEYRIFSKKLAELFPKVTHLGLNVENAKRNLFIGEHHGVR